MLLEVLLEMLLEMNYVVAFVHVGRNDSVVWLPYATGIELIIVNLCCTCCWNLVLRLLQYSSSIYIGLVTLKFD